MLSKLQYYGIRSNVFHWISAFLLNRRQRVVLDGCPSDWCPVTSGVPQGSVLGPLLFLLYINDIADLVKCTIRLFADDLIMYSQITNNSSISNFQKDLDTLHSWSVKWDMKFNLNKCHIIKLSRKQIQYKHKYTLGSFTLPYCNTFTYLGITVSSDLSWSNHINNIATKATNTLNFIKRNIYFLDATTKSKAYLSLVRPHLEYSSAAWDPYYCKDTILLDKVQNRAARFVTNTYSRTASVSKLVTDLGWPVLQSRRQIARLSELFKLIHGESPLPASSLLVRQRFTRSSSNSQSFINISTRTNIYKYSFFPRSIAEWNGLPVEIRSSPSLGSFKLKLGNHLSSHCQPFHSAILLGNKNNYNCLYVYKC